ncbi:hypothetical protein GCM10022384_54320 [Streptomyces marokkonensis]|uniref:Uncharacterized protein n=1 Tax=Streptomyces marokkonensis TaxID=324855 RepID=A0ABP7RPJ1_9ACTN
MPAVALIPITVPAMSMTNERSRRDTRLNIGGLPTVESTTTGAQRAATGYARQWRPGEAKTAIPRPAGIT